jgi:hypothetical protein
MTSQSIGFIGQGAISRFAARERCRRAKSEREVQHGSGPRRGRTFFTRSPSLLLLACISHLPSSTSNHILFWLAIVDLTGVYLHSFFAPRRSFPGHMNLCEENLCRKARKKTAFVY